MNNNGADFKVCSDLRKKKRISKQINIHCNSLGSTPMVSHTHTQTHLHFDIKSKKYLFMTLSNMCGYIYAKLIFNKPMLVIPNQKFQFKQKLKLHHTSEIKTQRHTHNINFKSLLHHLLQYTLNGNMFL